jgi:hypothetical protein
MDVTRRTVLTLLLALGVTCANSFAAAAATQPSLPPKLDASVERGLTFLARQQASNGAFGTGTAAAPGKKPPPRAALTALALIGFLAAGHTPDEGKYGLTVREAVDWLVAQVPPDGYVGRADGSRMYGQAVVTLALAEAYGVEPQPQRRAELRAALDRLAKVIVAAQATEKPQPFAGGWRYEPDSADADLSLTGWNALALCAARSVEIDVPAMFAPKSSGFVRRCTHPAQKGFAYQPGGEPSVAMTGVGILTLSLLAGNDADADPPGQLSAAGRWLAEHPLRLADTDYPYYAAYYVTQAAYHGGEDVVSPALARSVLDRVIRAQDKDGGWPQPVKGEAEYGRLYSSAMAVLTLTVPYRLLPVYQQR